MKKRKWLITTAIASAFLALATIPLFSSSKVLEVSAATDLGTIKVGSHERTFTTSSDLVNTMSSLMSNECKDDYDNKDVVLTLYADVTASDFLPKKPNGGDLFHSSVTINLNGHKLTVTGARKHNLGSLVINGGGGRIDFNNTNYGNPIFSFNSNTGGNEFSIKNALFENMVCESLFYVNECSDTISSDITIENCFFNKGSFTSEGGIIYFNDGEIKNINLTNCSFRNLSSKDYASVVYVCNQYLQNLNIKGCTFLSCSSGYGCNGGAIHINQNNVYVGNNSNRTFDKNFFLYCNADNAYGGAIYSNGSNTKFENFTFFNCSSYGGGGICLNQNSSTISRCSFYYNSATYYGGAICIDTSSCKVIDSTFGVNTNTTSGYEGYDIYSKSTTECSGCMFNWASSHTAINCNISDAQKNTSSVIKFSDARNYSNGNLIRGSSQTNPIFIATTDDLYALYSNMDLNASTYGNLHYLLINPLPGFPGFYNNLKSFTGTFNFGGCFLKFGSSWNWPEGQIIDPSFLDISDTNRQEDGCVRVNLNGIDQYFRPICDLNVLSTKLETGNYIFYKNTTIDERLFIEGDVTILVNDGVTVTVNEGINVSSGNKLHIIGKNINNKGILNSFSSNMKGAGIGGGYGSAKADSTKGIIELSGETMGEVSIQNMIVNAKGSGGAGIGGGAGQDGAVSGSTLSAHAAPGGDGGTLIITDSEITAEGSDGRDIGGGNGGDGANEASGGGKGSNIVMNSGKITATRYGIGGGDSGKQGSEAYGTDISYGSKHGGDGGKLDFRNGIVIAKGIGGGNGLLNKNEHDIDPSGLPTNMIIPTNYGISYGADLNSLSPNQAYDSTLDPLLKVNYVQIKVYVLYNFRIDSHTCSASYELNGKTYNEVVSTTHVVDQSATCTTNEIAHEDAVFSDPNIAPASSISAPVDGTALGHNYGGNVDYVRDGGKVTATWYCQRTGCDSVQSETVDLKYKTDTPATCTTNETGHLEGEFTKGFPLYKTENNSEVIIDSYLGHKISGSTTYKWDGDTCTATAYCETCKKNVSETAKGTFVQDFPENCTEPEKGHYHADFKYNFQSTDSEKGMIIGPTQAYGHNFNGKVVYEWNYETYECTATVMCINRDCDEIFTETVQGIAVYDIQPTCVDNAIGHYVATFTQLPGIFKTQMTEYADVEIPNSALGHNFTGKITYYWNTETNQCTASWHCSRCEEYESETVDGTFEQDTPPTCEENAKGHCIAIFKNENFNTGQTTEPNSVEIPNTALGHQYGGTVTYEWDEQTLQWTGSQACQREGCDGIYSETCDGKFVETVAPTCLDDAKGYYISDFETTGFEQQTTEKTDYVKAGSALGHEFGGKVTYVWNDETHSCTATWGCIREGCHATQSETVQGEYVMDTPATCLTNEFGHFEAHFVNENFESQSTEANSFEKLFSALGHEFGGSVGYTWDDETHECTAIWGCIHGSCSEKESETVQGVYVKDSDATCLENEKGHYEATFTNPGFVEQSTKSNSTEIPNTALGHKWGGNIVYSWNSITHECTALMKCDHVGCSESQIETVQGVYVKDSDATCLENEKGHYEATFVNSYFKMQVSAQIEIPDTALGHNIVITYEWNEDYTQCISTLSCSRGDHEEKVTGTITYEYGYAIAKFDDSRLKTQSIKMVHEQKEITPEEKNEQLVTYIFAGSCGGLTLAAILGIVIAAKRKIF